jgi:hypothetical protein
MHEFLLALPGEMNKEVFHLGTNDMKNKSLFVLVVSLLTMTLIATSCAATKTVTVYTAPPINTTATNPVPTKFVTPTVSGNYLPTQATPITSHMSNVLDSVQGECLACHGAGAPLQFPLPPTWDGSKFSYPLYTSTYTVIAGSIQDHTGRTADQCFSCHAISYS